MFDSNFQVYINNMHRIFGLLFNLLGKRGRLTGKIK